MDPGPQSPQRRNCGEDPIYTFRDYVEGRVGKLKDKAAAESSSSNADGGAKLPEKAP
ncbi:hypothetical protein U1Q18_023514 [Sarracenia purpurea var. burkii]